MLLYINQETAAEADDVNPEELDEVRREHMPHFAVRFAAADELHRVAEEVTRQHPRLREETQYVVVEELGRRHTLGTLMQTVKGGLLHA
jgi:hypothetical protein